MQNKLVSIIVPIYNVEKYLRDCVDSILNQTYKKIEVILVDDKTPDDSGSIADKYANKDTRVKVIHKQQNEGLNMARATGFNASTGDYVMFVDGDDMVAVDCVEFSLSIAEKNDAEIVKFNSVDFSHTDNLPGSLESTDELNKQEAVLGKAALLKARFNSKILGVSRVTVWGGLYARSLVEKIDWSKSNYRQHEDSYWTLQLLDNASKAVHVSRAGYYYRINDARHQTLSRQLKGNEFNGSPVGLLEFASGYIKELRRYNEKHDLGIDDTINRFMTWQWVDSLAKLSKANMLETEGNPKYLPEAINAVISAYKKEQYDAGRYRRWIYNQKQTIGALRAELNNIHSRNERILEKNNQLEEELKSFLSVKRSARLLLGNIKRKLGSIIK